MKFLGVVFLLLAMAGSGWAEEPALTEKTLPAIKASLGLPAGWFVKEETEDGVVNYQISREKVKGDDGTYVAGLTLTVTPKVQERAEMSASKYAEELVEGMSDQNHPVQKSEDGPYKIFRVEYVIEGDPGNISICNYARANDTTGTLYFISWQGPVVESDKLDPLRDKILASFKTDPTF